MIEKYLKNIPFEEVLNVKGLVEYADGSVGSRTLVQREDSSVTLFAFDKGEGVSEYSMPGDTMVHAIDGKAEVTIGEDTKLLISEGETVVIPADVPHSLESIERFKMLLIVIKPQNR